MSFDFDVEQDYFQWLCDIVGIEHGEEGYNILARDLFRTTFYSIVPHDENRAMDGIALREEYIGQVNYPKYIHLDGECNMLEMLIGLARRISYETDSAEYTRDTTSEWFWQLVRNLGLDVFNDSDYARMDGTIKVDEILNRFLERNYQWDGRGGLFPLNDAEEDQRDVEIWYQKDAYLMERDAV